MTPRNCQFIGKALPGFVQDVLLGAKCVFRYLLLFPLFTLLFTTCSPLPDEREGHLLQLPLREQWPILSEQFATGQLGLPRVITGIYLDYFEPVDQRFKPFQRYRPDPGGLLDSLWTQSYLVSMKGLHQFILQADAGSSPAYAGMARILLAISLGNLSSWWGDIPYSAAFGDADRPDPVYDSQEKIHEEIQELLDRAITELSKSSNRFVPGAEDLFFGGDRAAWTRAAYALKARYFMRLSQIDPQAGEKVLQALAFGMESSGNDMLWPNLPPNFLGPPASARLTTATVSVDSAFIQVLNNLSDPRKSFYILSKGGFLSPGSFLTSSDYQVPVVSYMEQEFIKAEVYLERGETTAARNTLRNAIRTSLISVTRGSLDPVKLDSLSSIYSMLTGNKQSNLDRLMTQKYIAMYGQTEAWTDVRRRSLPVLPGNPEGVFSGNPGGKAPLRFPYPLSEMSFNSRIPKPIPGQWLPLWWDVE